MDIEIWSDIACPWCYIGKRNFEKALTQFEHADEVKVSFRAFELDPDTPAEAKGDRAEKLAAKYGLTVERAREMEAQMVQRAAGAGLEYHLDQARMANTFDAHRTIALAAEHGHGTEMKERLLAAYFTDGRLISDHETLAELAGEVGLDPDEVRTALASDRHSDTVRGDEQTARELGITGVPMFVVDRTYGVSGAQPPELLLQMLQHCWEQSHPLKAVPGAGSAPGAAAGESCGVDGC